MLLVGRPCSNHHIQYYHLPSSLRCYGLLAVLQYLDTFGVTPVMQNPLEPKIIMEVTIITILNKSTI